MAAKTKLKLRILQDRLRAWQDWEFADSNQQDIEYLKRRRRITIPVSPDVVRPYLNGIICAVTISDDEFVGVQIKMPHRYRKGHSIGCFEDGSVKLSEPMNEVLGLAEGVEDALSVEQLFGIPCWATLGANRLDTVFVPSDVRELHLFADNDDPGRAAVRRAVAWHTGEGRRVTVHWPPDEYKDWNEFVVKESGG
jgi:Toprim domain